MKENKFYNIIYQNSPFALKNLYATLYSGIVSKRKYGESFEHWKEQLVASQYYNTIELKKHQINIFKTFIQSVYENAPFYRRIIDNKNINIRNINDLGIIKMFPIINKSIVRNNYNDIVNKYNSSYKFSTSGTTGTSLQVHLSKVAYQREYAYRIQFFNNAGANRKDKFVYLIGNKLFPASKTIPPFYIKDFYENGLYFSVFHMNDKNMHSYVDALNKFKPDFIKGYPSAVFTLAEFVLRYGLTIHSPKAVFCASETLHDFQKGLISNIFNCNIFEWYGQVETTVNIQECEYHNKHVMEDYGYLELLNDNGLDARPGEIANVIGTSWNNTAFPLIRYYTGDNMVLSKEQKCECGRTGRIIEKIIGRDEDIIITPDGRKIGRLDFVFKPINSVLESQIIQESTDKIVVKIVPLANFQEKDNDDIISKLRSYIGERMTISVVMVDSIERTNNGKIRYVISKVKTEPKEIV